MEKMGISNLRDIRVNPSPTRRTPLIHLRTFQNALIDFHLAQLHPKTHSLHTHRLLWTIYRRLDRRVTDRNNIAAYQTIPDNPHILITRTPQHESLGEQPTLVSLRALAPSLTRITIAGAIGAALHVGQGNCDCYAC